MLEHILHLTTSSAIYVVCTHFSSARHLLIDFLDCSELLLELHPPVLEPYFDLALREAERVSDFNSPASRQVVVEVKLLLQLQGLEAGVRLAAAAPWTPVGTCGGNWHPCHDGTLGKKGGRARKACGLCISSYPYLTSPRKSL